MSAPASVIRTVHRTEFTGVRKWKWGWVAIDPVDDTAIGVISAFDWPGDDGDVAYPVVHIIYARRERGLGLRLAERARDDLGVVGLQLHRSGVATPKGLAVCLEAGLPIDPFRLRVQADYARKLDRWKRLGQLGIEPTKPHGPTLATDEAVRIGHQHLVHAAQILNITAVTPKPT